MNNFDYKVLAVIPARGGSKGIPRKNIRHLDGKPLIAYTIEAALSTTYIDRVIVSTDDSEIAEISKKYGAEVIFRPEHLASDEVPLDPVIFDAVEKIEVQDNNTFDIVLTIQPTSPLLRKGTIEKIIEKLVNEHFDTVLTAVDDRHLSWKRDGDQFLPNYLERKNRQYLPSEYRETGAVLASRRSVITPNSRIGEKVSLYEVDKYESIDIDSQMDWWIAEKLLNKKKVVIRVDGYEKIGLGHIYRTLTLANNIMDHDLIFLMNSQHRLGIDLVKSQNFKVVEFDDDSLSIINSIKPDIVINDILDTTKEYILSLKEVGIKIFNFEDLGTGAEYADGVFNALYPGSVPSSNFYTGEKYYCAKNEFLNVKHRDINKKVENVLITYGGTDPNNLTYKTLSAITQSNQDFNITIILGPGYSKEEILYKKINTLDKNIKVYRSVKNMADHMVKADIIFSSAGRTMYEIAMVGTPAIIISQNYREMTHLFGHNYNGFVNLGIHLENDEERILNTFERLIMDYDLRCSMNKRMLDHDLSKGLERVLNIIFKD
ncbi:UDP-2,4-diacetamido-2,4,6-trideoxy-beta-L-altropyranose hydrolase [Mesobacillus foraminis]|uniref:cytidylyltransferase domain-containing protein n=1 Tax=Mesobacillus foraminis TaxID=279826 RepID=UPI001BE5EDE3|nr:glycosyltransferase [Mesobacillus foraminis]MBT2756713.1 UDP-2,4-diacetamido-2,4,6-trideoxy-beta-L-altropyranose hydrolase [Mesobacillus foraminis]